MYVRGLRVLGEGAVKGYPPNHGGDEIGEGDAAYSADGGDGHGFGQELEQDVFAARAQRLLHADLAGALLHGDQHDVHETDAGDAEGERSHQREQHLQGERENFELMQLRHEIRDVYGVVVRGAEMVGRGQGLAQALLRQFIVAGVTEPDSVQVGRVLDVAHGAEGDIDLAVDVVIGLLHFGEEDADDGERLPIEADTLTEGPFAGEELGLCLRTDDADMGALLVFGAIEEAALIDVEFEDVLVPGAHAVHAPGVDMQVILHRDILGDGGRDVPDSGNTGGDAIDVIEGKADTHAGLVSAGLLAGGSREDADGLGAPLREDGLDGAAEAVAIGQQQHYGGDAPGHADHGNGGAATVVEHRLPGLSEDVLEHDSPLVLGARYQARG